MEEESEQGRLTEADVKLVGWVLERDEAGDLSSLTPRVASDIAKIIFRLHPELFEQWSDCEPWEACKEWWEGRPIMVGVHGRHLDEFIRGDGTIPRFGGPLVFRKKVAV